MEIVKDLIQGNKFIKYGRQGKPHLKLVQITSNEDRVAWRSPKKEKSKISYIMFSEIIEVAVGHNTSEVLRKNKVPAEFDELCFSIIAKSRTLDLKAETVDIRCKWVQYFKNRII